MQSSPGRREQNRLDTLAALRRAAAELFAEKGFETTSVREIAERAGIGERTFYRYFDGKDELLAEDVQRALQELGAAIADRPADEPALAAVRAAVVELARRRIDATGTDRSWLVADSANPLELLRRAAPRPLVRFEETIAEALAARDVSETPAALANVQLLARVCVAVIRTAALRRRQLLAQRGEAPAISALLDDAFTELGAATTALR